MSKLLGNEILELVGEIQNWLQAEDRPHSWFYLKKECGYILSGGQKKLTVLIGELRSLDTPETVEFADRLESLQEEIEPDTDDGEANDDANGSVRAGDVDDSDQDGDGVSDAEDDASEPADEPPPPNQQVIPPQSHAPARTAPQTPAARPAPNPSAPAQKQKSPPKPPGKLRKLKHSKKKKAVPTGKVQTTPQAEAPTETTPVAAKAPATTETTSVPHHPQSSQVGVVNTEATSGNAIDKKEETSSSSSSSEKPPPAAEHRMVPVLQLDSHPLVKDFFQRDESTFAALKESMFLRGFDHAHPLTVVEGPNGRWLVVDGNTRLAALPPDLEYVPVIVVTFPSDAELLAFVARTQLFRRNTSDPELLKAAEILIPIEEARAKERRGRMPKLKPSASNDADIFMSSSKAVGAMLNRSKSTVDRIKRILRDGMMRGRVLKGKISISAAYAKLMRLDRRRAYMAAGSDVTGDASTYVFTPMQIDVPPGTAADEKQYLVAESVLALLAASFPSEQFQTLAGMLELCDSEARTFIIQARNRRRKAP